MSVTSAFLPYVVKETLNIVHNIPVSGIEHRINSQWSHALLENQQSGRELITLEWRSRPSTPHTVITLFLHSDSLHLMARPWPWVILLYPIECQNLIWQYINYDHNDKFRFIKYNFHMLAEEIPVVENKCFVFLNRFVSFL